MDESDPRSNVLYLSSSENKAWKKIQACTCFFLFICLFFIFEFLFIYYFLKCLKFFKFFIFYLI